jgi:hypothetical protein
VIFLFCPRKTPAIVRQRASQQIIYAIYTTDQPV